ncbi:MAG: hypothetical protein Q4C42_00410 [Clostridia bacterium]|nr:hypothetical protein [Clostridia bacterium]
MREVLNAKQKAFFWGIIGVLIFMIASVLFVMFRSLNPPPKQGEMFVSSSDATVTAVANVIKVTEKSNETNFRTLNMEEIADELPLVEYDGEDITVNFTDGKDTLNDFAFTMYDEEFNEVYKDSKKFLFPENEGTYIVRTVFSWGYNKKNCIQTENFYKIHFSEESLEGGHTHE